jgi:lysozyme family protein
LTLQEQNNDRWSKVRINPNRDSLFTSVARRLTNPTAVARYKAVETRTGVPWWFIAVVHEREASQAWTKSIAQGDPWNRVSTHVPAGRGPFKSWEDAAVDALVNCAPYAARNKDWSPGGALTLLEKYNGLGYAKRGKPSPYIWAGTNQYVSGKYVADGVYNPSAVDKQLGCAGLLLKMGAFDKPVVKSEHAGAGGVVVAGATAASNWPEYAAWIIGGTVVAAFIAYVIIKTIKAFRKGK